jgi:hypothetical protein
MIDEVVESIFSHGYVPNERNINASLVFVDESFAEMSQWQGRHRVHQVPNPIINHENIQIYPLTSDMADMKTTIISVLSEYLEETNWQGNHDCDNNVSGQQWLIVIATASLDIEVISSIQYLLTTLSIFTGENHGRLLTVPHCVIVTTISPPAMNQYSYITASPSSPQITSSTRNGHNNLQQDIPTEYARFLEYLSPALPTQVLYWPRHSMDLLHHLASDQVSNPTSSPPLQLNIITNQDLREIRPMTLHHLETKYRVSGMNSVTDEPFQSIWELTAADLPQEVKQSLKSFAYELAGTLIFDLGLDVSSSIFTLGKTSSLVGHSLQVGLRIPPAVTVFVNSLFLFLR